MARKNESVANSMYILLSGMNLYVPRRLSVDQASLAEILVRKIERVDFCLVHDTQARNMSTENPLEMVAEVHFEKDRAESKSSVRLRPRTSTITQININYPQCVRVGNNFFIAEYVEGKLVVHYKPK